MVVGGQTVIFTSRGESSLFPLFSFSQPSKAEVARSNAAIMVICFVDFMTFIITFKINAIYG